MVQCVPVEVFMEDSMFQRLNVACKRLEEIDKDMEKDVPMNIADVRKQQKK